jgi:PST family polysaccharide transporter
LKQPKSSSVGVILKACAIMGSSSVIAVVAGIAKNKIMALLLGPAGVGLFGLLQSVLATAGTVAGMGIASSGVRQVAACAEEPEQLSRTRGALWWSSLGLGAAGALAMLLFGEEIGRLAMGKAGYGTEMAWLGIGVAATVLTGTQIALLNGLHRLKDLAWINIAGALGGLLAAGVAVGLWQSQGVLAAVIAAPLASLAVSWWCTARVAAGRQPVSRSELSEPTRQLFRLGFMLMLSGLVTTGMQLAVRSLVARKLGLEAAGHFQAAWGISMSYMGLVLGSMGTDYYPRLSAAAADDQASRTMMNEQIEVVLLLIGPVILGMLSLAPQVVGLLYSSAFTDTVAILRWQILGDLLKVVSWPIGFILLAHGMGRTFFATELLWNLNYFGLVWLGLGLWGLPATGIAFLVSYLVQFLVCWWLAHRICGFWPNRTNLAILGGLLAGAGIIFLVGSRASLAGTCVSLVLTALATALCYHRLYSHYRNHKANPAP